MNISGALPAPSSSADSEQDPGLTATVYDNGDTAIVEVSGEVDMRTAPLLRDALSKSLHDHPRVLVVDLLAVNFFGSSGLALLLETQQLAGEHTRLRVVADGPTTRRPLQLTGLDQQFALYPTREDALRSA
jgi:anti-sigma B factor antagonist